MHISDRSQSSIIDENISKRITSLRYILMIFVVVIHSHLSVDEAVNYYHYEFSQPYWIEILKNFITFTISSSAVPLFFVFSAYIQYRKNDKYLVVLKKRSRTILIPYILWTVITVLLFYIAQSIPQTRLFFQNPENMVSNWKLKDWLSIFTFHTDTYPLVYQFWFLRELMIFIVLSPILKLLIKKIPGCLLIFLFIATQNNISLYFTSSASALFFYAIGFYFAENDIDFFKLADKMRIFEYVILFAICIILSEIKNGQYSIGFISTIISCLFMLKISSFLVKNENLYKVLNKLSSISFFFYAVHAPFLVTTVNKITQKIIPLHGIYCLLQFLLAIIVTTVLGTLFSLLVKTFFPRLFSILSGKR